MIRNIAMCGLVLAICGCDRDHSPDRTGRETIYTPAQLHEHPSLQGQTILLRCRATNFYTERAGYRMHVDDGKSWHAVQLMFSSADLADIEHTDGKEIVVRGIVDRAGDHLFLRRCQRVYE